MARRQRQMCIRDRKYIDDKNVIETEIDSQKQRIEFLERNNLDQEKKDMWDD